MKKIVFYFDVASPLAWLAFEQLPQALAGANYWVEYQPVSGAALLGRPSKASGQDADATMRGELPAAQPLADAWQIRLVPPRRGFDSQPLLQLALACASQGTGPNRFVVEQLMHHVWRADGLDPLDPDRFAALLAMLTPQRRFDATDVRAELSAANHSANVTGVGRIPTFRVPSLARQFDSVDSLPQLAQALTASR